MPQTRQKRAAALHDGRAAPTLELLLLDALCRWGTRRHIGYHVRFLRGIRNRK